MKILVFTPLDHNNRQLLRQQLPASAEVTFHSALSANDLEQAFQHTEIIMGNPPAGLFKNVPPKLSFWQLDSAGFHQYRDVKLNIPVSNMGDFFSRPCAETIVGGILAFYRHIHELVLLQSRKEWIGQPIRFRLELLGDKNVIILGAGGIGMAVKQMLSGFGCKVKMSARKNPEADFHDTKELIRALPETDLLINTLPGTADNFVTKEFFDALKNGALYASVGRGNTTDETALIAALESKKLAGAVLDVTAVEPLPTDNKLWDMGNVILTQHSGGGQRNEDLGKVKQFISNLNRFISGEKVQDTIDLTRGY